MSKHIRHSIIVCLALLLSGVVYVQASPFNELNVVTITGQVLDTEGEPLAGVNVVVKGTIVGTPTNSEGSFELTVNQDFPLTLQFSIVGFQTQELEVTSSNANNIVVTLTEQTIYGNDVVVSASRVEESILEAPVSIEKMDILTVKNSASDDYYSAISNLKGVDMTASSINFQIINSRGFNSTGNTRMVQLTDGMDTQAPALNFPIGNLNGPSELDVESVEFIPGAASALYGPNAFNGILLVNSKNPFRYQGLSVKLKAGVNHLDGNVAVGEPESAQPMYSFAMRYAQAFNQKFAFKVNLAYSQAEDWRGTDFSDKNANLQGNLSANPAYDGIHRYGDDGSVNIALLGLNPAFIQAFAAQTGMTTTDAQAYASANLPNQPVSRTGYDEHYLVDYGAENLKASASAHYRLTDNAELSYTFNYGYGTSIYTGAQRYSLVNFSIAQHKLQLEGDNFLVKAYGTFENSGDSYVADFVGFAVNEAYSNSRTQWYPTYGIGYLGFLLANGVNGNATAAQQSAAHQFARVTAEDVNGDGNSNRLEPGTAGFDAAVDAALGSTIPNGALFDDKSKFYHAEGQYNFKNEIDFMDLIVGASFRQFQLRSNGTIFDDADGVDINEFGGFLQGSKSLMDDRLKLSASVRYDKNENFDGQISPRIAAVATVADNQNIRASYQTGFRNPTTQGQYIDLNVITARLLGGLPQFATKYDITTNTYTFESVQAFTNTVLSGTPNPTVLVAYSEHKPVKPEQIQAFEVGYKGLISNKLFVDLAYYYNIYDDFITQIRVRKASGAFSADPVNNAQVTASLLSGDASNTFQIYTNNSNTVKAHGAVLGFEYSLPQGYKLGFNYNYNKLLEGLEDQFQNDFNTPEHKFNVSFANRKVIDNLGFNVTYRWQDAFRWESSFAFVDVDAVSTIDAQISYELPDYNATVKVGGSNITNEVYTLSGGGPSMGGIYYVSLVFDNLFTK